MRSPGGRRTVSGCCRMPSSGPRTWSGRPTTRSGWCGSARRTSWPAMAGPGDASGPARASWPGGWASAAMRPTPCGCSARSRPAAPRRISSRRARTIWRGSRSRRRWACSRSPRRSLAPFLHLDDLVGDGAVCLAVDGLRGLLAGSLDEAEDLARSLVVPVLQVVDAVLVLALQVLAVGVGEPLRGQPVDLVVHVEIERHIAPP